jgi:hypothetical protein
MEEEIKNDGFIIDYNDKYIKISTIFFDKIKSNIYIYPLENDVNDDILKYTNINKELIKHQFYDIFPLKKNNFEEFEVSVPNKIEKVLESYNIDLNYITFTNKKIDNKLIIEEIDSKKNINSIIKDNFNNFISVIKPFFFE